MMRTHLVMLCLLSAGLLACGKKDTIEKAVDPEVKANVYEKDTTIPGNSIINVQPETEKLIKNPLVGWAIYGTPGAGASFWTNFDNINVPDLGKKIKIADYASELYIRVGWSDLEPAEGQYAWNNNDLMKMLISGAKERGLKLAFRIVVDSRDKATDFTPGYVKSAGAQGYTTQTGSKTVWSPYPDDPVFQQKYEKFVKAFAEKFDDPNVVDFIDGYGLGKWGESHSVLYLNEANRTPVYNWITNLYIQSFKHVLLAINYHRMIGTPKEWGDPDPNSATLLASAFNKGYLLRHDAFGMTDYYKSFEKVIAAQWYPTRPVIAEGGWLHNGDGYLKDPRGYKNWGDVWKGEYDDAVVAHVNVMDLRNVVEASSWFETAYPLILKFIATGGYRFYPSQLSLPQTLTNNTAFKISHQWQNLGMGMCPTNLPQWNQKYKVAFALLDKNSNAVKAVFVDTNTDLSKWAQGKPTNYDFSDIPKNTPAGTYQWAVGIVDVSQNNQRGINLAAKGNITTDGWLTLMDVTVK